MINTSYGMSGYCTVTCDQIDTFLNSEKDQVSFGLEILIPSIELISNSTNSKIEEAIKLLEIARDIIEREVQECSTDKKK